MQIAVIDFARHVAGLKNSNSTEFDANTPHPVIDIMEDQKTLLLKEEICVLDPVHVN